jgi:hypothetical protein
VEEEGKAYRGQGHIPQEGEPAHLHGKTVAAVAAMIARDECRGRRAFHDQDPELNDGDED